MSIGRKLRLGMVGGGRGAFIGSVHRMAATLDGQIELVAGAFSADPEKSKLSGQDLFLDSSRVYDSYQQMAAAEAELPADQRIDFVTVVTRNDTHFDVASCFLDAGIHVVCEKPLSYDIAQAKALVEKVNQTGLLFGLTHNYTGYPMVKEAKAMVKEGKLGDILKIVVEYPQGYAVTALDQKNQGAISNWRMDPKVSGASNCIGDIGSHAENLARYITGLEIDEVAADLSTFIPGRQLDDDGNMLVRYRGGAKGILYASQISAGEENGLNIRVYGTKASLEWHQEHPNELIVKFAEQPRQIHRRGNVYNGEACQKYTRLPFGHPEAFVAAFANIYLAFGEAVIDRISGDLKKEYDFPSVADGLIGMAFIEAAVKSSENNSAWTKLAV